MKRHYVPLIPSFYFVAKDKNVLRPCCAPSPFCMFHYVCCCLYDTVFIDYVGLSFSTFSCLTFFVLSRPNLRTYTALNCCVIDGFICFCAIALNIHSLFVPFNGAYHPSIETRSTNWRLRKNVNKRKYVTLDCKPVEHSPDIKKEFAKKTKHYDDNIRI